MFKHCLLSATVQVKYRVSKASHPYVGVLHYAAKRLHGGLHVNRHDPQTVKRCETHIRVYVVQRGGQGRHYDVGVVREFLKFCRRTNAQNVVWVLELFNKYA